MSEKSYYQEAKKLLKMHEGLRLKPYRDTKGKLTIGYGHNLENRGIPLWLATALLEWDMDEHDAELAAMFPVVHGLDPARRAALLDMAFNMGIPALRSFKRMWDAIGRRDWEAAAAEALDSKWAKVDHPPGHARPQRISRILRTGEIE